MEMGVSLSAAYMGISGGDGVSLAPRLGVRGALVMSLCWSERYALQVELAYLFNKIRAERSADEGGVKSGMMYARMSWRSRCYSRCAVWGRCV